MNDNLEGKIEKPKFGADVSIRNFWVRHAEKMSAAITSSGGAGLSTSSISEKGAIGSQEFGEEIEGQTDGVKGYISTSERTQQTIENILEGYQRNNDVPVRESLRVKRELTSSFPPGFLKIYDDKFVTERNRVMKDRGMEGVDFFSLSPADQDEIAQVAEEPIMMEWLSNDKNELVELYPPQEAAAKFAKLFSRRHERLASKIHSGSQLDLLHVTHKTITEPFLVSGVLLRQSDGSRITKIDELGGSLGTLDNWESSVTTDITGDSHVIIRIRGIEYKIDHDKLESLLNYGKETNS